MRVLNEFQSRCRRARARVAACSPYLRLFMESFFKFPSIDHRYGDVGDSGNDDPTTTRTRGPGYCSGLRYKEGRGAVREGECAG